MQSAKVNFAFAAPNIFLDSWIQIQILSRAGFVLLPDEIPQNVFN